MEILSPPLIDTLRLVLEFIATAAFALSGVIMAARKRLDVVGVCVVGFLAAFGGGTLRDILLDRRPLFWVTHQEYAILIFVLALLAAGAESVFAIALATVEFEMFPARDQPLQENEPEF